MLVYDALARPGRRGATSPGCNGRHPQRIIARHRRHPRRARRSPPRRADAEAVFHFAAQVAVTTSLVDPREDFDINVRGTLNLLEALRRRNEPAAARSSPRPTRSMATSPTSRSTRRTTPIVPRDPALRAHGIGEDRPLDFHTPYGCSKGAADQYVLDYARSFGVPTAVLRMSCIYGPRQMGTEDQGWVAHFLIRALAGRADHASTATAGRCATSSTSPTPSRPIVSAWRRIDAVAGRAFNLGGGPANAVSLRQLLAPCRGLDRPAGRDCRFSDWRAGDQRYYVSDTRRATRALGLRPPIPWRNGVAALARWLADERGSRRGCATPSAASAPQQPPRPLSCEARSAHGGGARVGAADRARTAARSLMTADAVGGVWHLCDSTSRGALGRPRRRDDARRARARRHRRQRSARPVGVPRLALLDHRPAARLDRRASPGEVADAGAPLPRWRREVGRRHRSSQQPGACRRMRAFRRRSSASPFLRRDLVAGGPRRRRSRRTSPGAPALRRAGLARAPMRSSRRRAAFAADDRARLRHCRAAARGPQRPAPRRAARAGRAEQPFVFTAGRLWDEGKNLAALDRAAARLAVPVLAAGPARRPERRARSRCRHARPLGALGERGDRSAGSRARPVFASRRPLRAVRPGGARSGAGRLRARARRHPDLPRAVGRRGAVRRRPMTTQRARGGDRRRLRRPIPHRARGTRRCRAQAAAGALHRRGAWPRGHDWRSTRPARRAAAPAARHGGRGMRVVVFHPLARLVLEPRQRAFPARRAARAGRTRPRRRGLRARRARWSLREPAARTTARPALAAYRERLSRSCRSHAIDADVDLDGAPSTAPTS